MTAMAGLASTTRTFFGARRRAPKPVLLILVSALVLLLVGLTALAQTVIVTLHISTASLNASLDSDAATVRTFVNGFLEPADLTPDASPSRIETVDAGLRALVEKGEILRIEIRDPGGAVRLTSTPAASGIQAPMTDAYRAALRGELRADILEPDAPTESVGGPLPVANVVREYLPLQDPNGVVRGIVGIWRDAGPILAAIDRVRRDVVIVMLSAAAVASLMLYLIFRTAQRRITKQTDALIEATRRDPLTGTLNHGALVDELAIATEAARASGGSVSVAHIDVDNFKLLNDNHGHQAGDDVLLDLAADLAKLLPAEALYGRFGPDEFLVVAPGIEVTALEPVVDAVRERLASRTLRFTGTEDLPISMSAGLASFPEHASSVTGLLVAVADVLADAKASGGDATRISGRTPVATPESRRFDVYQGLVLAIDTKDRYTKRHSEDVARYAMFLGRLLGKDDAMLEVIRQAGLLHDIGKIGIPDGILRKPSRLTAEESAVVKQHVALGDMIVRDLPQIDEIRRAVRHHHERWDGRGYLDALRGDDIPEIARILAIADAFSAMTTSRPYRKALEWREATMRLGDAAGTQLDERMVKVFLDGLEADEVVTLPRVDRPLLWSPGVGVA